MTQVFGIQYDSTGPLPFVSAAIVAKYINGSFAQRPVHFGRGFVWIDVNGSEPGDAHWLDVERGDAAPGMVPRWLHERRQRTGDPGGIYCNRSTLPAVLEAAGNVPFELWLATLDGTVFPEELGHLPSTVRPVLVQAFPAALTGFHADLSMVIDQRYWDTRHA